MLHRHEFRAMGTDMLAVVDSEVEPAVLKEAPSWFEEWEQVLSRFRHDSELSQLNSRPGERRRVGATLWAVYREAVEAERLTGGLVNPLVLNALTEAGYDQSFDLMQAAPIGRAPAAKRAADVVDTARTMELPAFCSVIGDALSQTLCVPEAARLDFGGVAKGWAAAQAVRHLKAAGPALVSAGGDIAVSGPQSSGESWPIAVEDPFQPTQNAGIIYVERGGVATSGKDRRRWMKRGELQHHVIDPRTGLPADTDVLTATVIADTVMKAEALAKAILITGSQAGFDWLDSDNRVAGLLVLENGKRLYSRNLEMYL